MKIRLCGAASYEMKVKIETLMMLVGCMIAHFRTISLSFSHSVATVSLLLSSSDSWMIQKRMKSCWCTNLYHQSKNCLKLQRICNFMVKDHLPNIFSYCTIGNAAMHNVSIEFSRYEFSHFVYSVFFFLYSNKILQ